MTQFPSLFQNTLTNPGQNHLQQQPISQQNNTQPLQTKPIETFNQTGGFYSSNQQPISGTLATNPYSSGIHYSPCGNNVGNRMGSGFEAHQFIPQLPMTLAQDCNCLSHNGLTQIRSCTNAPSPIIILPNSNTSSNQLPPYLSPILSPIPYPLPLPIFNSVGTTEKEKDCVCSNGKKCSSSFEMWGKDTGIIKKENSNSYTEHECQESIDSIICSKKNCPASIQLQAMISQLLGIEGIVASAITRLLLKIVPGSNINETAEEIMECAKRCLKHLPKEQLLRESKNSQRINGLLSLYMTSSMTVAKVIPILTSTQLKSNILRTFVATMINERLMENQGYGAEAPEQLNQLLIELKTDDELRQLLAVLREKECDERVNLSFASYGSQRLITESRLVNIQRKIGQIENEMDRRRNSFTVIHN